jgi:hypothetical protein
MERAIAGKGIECEANLNTRGTATDSIGKEKPEKKQASRVAWGSASDAKGRRDEGEREIECNRNLRNTVSPRDLNPHSK